MTEKLDEVEEEIEKEEPKKEEATPQPKGPTAEEIANKAKMRRKALWWTIMYPRLFEMDFKKRKEENRRRAMDNLDLQMGEVITVSSYIDI